ncbi:MAG: SO_0444 family Cu/Zn efflux transporter [Thermoanaerobaculia bacterium]|nr:SO_0444 family Cu/Zn efflux transporter [Thermoanaerobaculia bacterium]
MTVLAAPFLLLGLAMAGFVHVLLPERVVQRYLGRPGLGGAATAAAIGVPLPVCSCGVLPLVVEMKRKRATDAASMSFLTTTPESGVDSVLFSWALLGPLMAVARPVAAFTTAMVGATWMTLFPGGPAGSGEEEKVSEASCGSCCSSEAVPAQEEPEGDRAGFVSTTTKALRYGFGELLDDIAFWLVLGLVLAGVLSAVLPNDLAVYGLGGGLWPMLVMLTIGIPLYICASASTPVAATLLAKGLSPGAALVFLLAGPATNAASLVVLTRTFGGRFVRVYLSSVAAGSLLCGLLLDAVMAAVGWTLVLPAVTTAHEHTAPWEVALAGVLVLLLVGSAVRGSLLRGWAEFAGGAGTLGRLALSRLGLASQKTS